MVVLICISLLFSSFSNAYCHLDILKLYFNYFYFVQASPVAQLVKSLLPMQE